MKFMSEKRNLNQNNSFIQQAGILAIAGIFARLLGFLYRLPLTNLIGDEGNAIYAVSFNIYTFLLILSSAGLPAAIAKMVSERVAMGRYDFAHRLFKLAMGLAFSVGLFFSVIVFIFAENITTHFFDMPEATLALQLLTPTIFIVAMMAVMRGYFQGMGKTKPTATSQILEQVFNAIFSIILAHSLWNFALSRSYNEFAYGAAGSTLGSTVGAVAGFMLIACVYFLFRKDIFQKIRKGERRKKNVRWRGEERRKPEKASALVKTIFATSFTIILGTAIFSVANLTDSWLVRSRLVDAGFTELRADQLFGQLGGKFYTITNIPAAITSSLAIALIPAISAAYHLKNHKEVRAKINIGLRVGMLLTIPIAFGLLVLGVPIIQLLFPNHPEGGTLFTWGFLSVIFLGTSQIATGALQALGKMRIPIYAALAGATAKIVSSYFLIGIPSINIYGAVIGTTICFGIAALINCMYLFKYTKTKPDIVGMFVKPIFASITMAVGVFVFYHISHIALNSNAAAVIISIIGGLMLYVIFMLLIKGISEEDVLHLPKGKRLLGFMKRKGLL